MWPAEEGVFLSISWQGRSLGFYSSFPLIWQVILGKSHNLSGFPFGFHVFGLSANPKWYEEAR